jgi:DNA-binding NarL/FixJ family response regulator
MQTTKTLHVMHTWPVMCAGLSALLQSDDWQLTLHEQRPDALAAAHLVVADYEIGLNLARTAFARRRDQEVLIVTSRDKEWDVRRALELGLAGYVLEDTSADQLQGAVRQVLNGARYLSPAIRERIEDEAPIEQLTRRERDVLGLLAKGHCNKQIARDLGIGLGTVKCHVQNLMGKLGASARTQAVVVAARRGLVGIDVPVRASLASPA